MNPKLPNTKIAQILEITDNEAMPHNFELERSVLGVFLQDRSIATQRALLVLSRGCFYDSANLIIFDAIKRCDELEGTVDIYRLGQMLKEQNELATIGGMKYLVSLMECSGSGANIEIQARMLIELAMGRELALLGYKTMRDAVSQQNDVAEIIQNISEKIEFAQLMSIQQSNRKSAAEVADMSINKAKERADRLSKGITTGISTGLEELDKWTNGWKGGELIVLAARPAMGKTALLLHFAVSAAKSNIPVLIYSLEMGNVSIGNRLLLSQCTTTPEALKSGRLDLHDWIRLSQAQDAIKQLPIIIDEKPAVNYQYVAVQSRILKKQGKCGIIFIDYLQLMTMRGSKSDTREREVAATSAALKQLTKELDVPIVLLSQLSRETERRGGNKEPMLSDLRESGAIEQDADMVMFIHRAEYYNPDMEYFSRFRLSNGKEVNDRVPVKGVGKLIISKYREGATGDVKFTYNPSLTHISDFDESPYIHNQFPY
ncbi:MAG: replicative DNA helicase [Rikenellaceae bacterium]